MNNNGEAINKRCNKGWRAFNADLERSIVAETLKKNTLQQMIGKIRDGGRYTVAEVEAGHSEEPHF